MDRPFTGIAGAGWGRWRAFCRGWRRTTGAMARAGAYEDMLGYHIMDCMECGSCSYVCPSNIPLVQRFRVAKGLLREKQAREAAEEAA